MFRQKPCFAAWLSAALLLVACSGHAGAGIVITAATIVPSGNALAAYDFHVSLAPNTGLAKNDFLTFLNVPDVDAKAGYAFLVGGVDDSKVFTVVTTPGASAGTSNLQFIFNQGPPMTFGNASFVAPLPIGDLIVGTSMAFARVAGSSLLAPIKYDSQAHQYNSNTIVSSPGITTPSVVPEPASLALVGMGLGLGWLAARPRRRD